MIKHWVTLVVILLLIVLITQVEDYLGKTDLSRLTMEKDQIDYYLSDFSIMAVAADGTVSYELSGRHLSHWQGKKQSQVIAPAIKTSNGLTLHTDHLLYDQASQTIATDAEVTITSPSGMMQSTGLTAKLDQDLLRFNTNVRSTYQVK
jgi:lipopolysaccharide export system protein LptC